MIKVCFKCHEPKDIDEFYKHPMMADGRLGKCKECAKADVRSHRRQNDSVREYDRQRYKNSVERQIAVRLTTDRWREENPEAVKAQGVLAYAIKLGKIVPQPCVVCGAKQVHGHHEDYNKPLDVIWYCAQHHIKHHLAK